MSAVDLTSNPQTNPNQLPGSQVGSLVAPTTTPAGATPATPQVDTSPMFSLPSNLNLAPQPNFPAVTPGPHTDAQYLAQEAALRYTLAKQYGDVLQQLGYVDPATGKTIAGQIEQGANIQGAGLQHDLEMEQLNNDRTMQNNGTIFSGIRGTELANAQYPTQQQLGQLQLGTAQQMQQQYESAQDIINQYNLQNNQLLADAATRALTGIEANPGGGAAGGAAGGGTGPIVGSPTGVGTGTLGPSQGLAEDWAFSGPNASLQYPTPPSAPSTPAPTPGPSGAQQQQQGGGTTFAGSTQGQSIIPGTATALGEGAVVDKPTAATIGEKGPEVVIPLRKLMPKDQIKLLSLAHSAGIYTEALKQAASA